MLARHAAGGTAREMSAPNSNLHHMIQRSLAAAAAFEQTLTTRGAVLLEARWLGARVPHRIRCAAGHETTTYPECVHRGGGICKVCAGLDPATVRDEFHATVAARGGAVLEPAWLGSATRHRVRCAAGHENLVLPRSVRQGGGICRTCSGRDPVAAETAFRAFLDARNATLLEPTWLGASTPHRIRCAAGHLSAPTPANVRRRQSICPTCAGNYRGKGATAFCARLDELRAELIEPTWLGAGTPHHVRCVNGHDCWPRPNGIKRGRGICPICAGQDKATAAAEFQARLDALGATLAEPEYLGANIPHRVICAEGHECCPYPTRLQQGGGICRICAHRTWDVFYIVTNQNTRRVKFGITSGDAKIRLTQHRRNGYRTTGLLMAGLQGTTAPDIERAVKAALRLAGIAPVHGREHYDIIALPVIFEIASNYDGDQAAASQPAA